MTTLEALKAARAKIAQGWTRESYARDTFGNPCQSEEIKATCWCMLGGLRAVTERGPTYFHALAELEACVPDGMGVTWFNDIACVTADDALRIYDDAIGLLEARAL